jgi:hypothetical protein
MEQDRKTRYRPPVESLLTYGESDRITPDAWPDYQELGMGPEQIPELIQMATDEALNRAAAESPEVWAPVLATWDIRSENGPLENKTSNRPVRANHYR